MKVRGAGFTLVELIAVIAIIAILSATAIPKFISVSTDARIAKVDAVAGALASTAQLVYAKCMVTPACDINSGSQAVTMSGVGYHLNYGYPDAGNALNAYQIDTAIQTAGYDIALVDHTRTIFKVPGAPNPDECAAVYKDAYEGSSNRQFSITKLTSAC